MNIELISLHGGHSGEFCNHAADRLEDIVRQYIRLGFKRVGITEHIPPPTDQFLYPDEIDQGLNPAALLHRFSLYFETIRSLQQRYKNRITLYAGMETETVTGFKTHVSNLVSRFKPDYLVGSVHHVNDICYDFSRAEYEKAVLSCGSVDALYNAYFDLQYDMITAVRPFVVGHFDLIRIFDTDYKRRLQKPGIVKRISRNLELIKDLGLVLDFNLRPLARGEKEPYITGSILDMAREMDLCLVPGDDSHSAAEAGNHVDTAIAMLQSKGFKTLWPEPILLPIE